MDTVKTIISILIIFAFGVVGVFLCMGKGSFLLVPVRDMEDGKKKTLITRIFGSILLAFTVFLIIAVFFK